jgi:hypothetical protein
MHLMEPFPHFRKRGRESSVDTSGKAANTQFSSAGPVFPQVFHNCIVDDKPVDFAEVSTFLHIFTGPIPTAILLNWI